MHNVNMKKGYDNITQHVLPFNLVVELTDIPVTTFSLDGIRDTPDRVETPVGEYEHS